MSDTKAKNKKPKRFPMNGPTYEMQARFHRGDISYQQLLEHIKDRQK